LCFHDYGRLGIGPFSDSGVAASWVAVHSYTERR
jgi:hypothetical protein